MTVLSSRGVPTPLAATRLVPPDSLMAALDPVGFQGRIATSPLTAKYGQAVDRQSAHEIIGARIASAKQAAADLAASGATPAGAADPAVAGSDGILTPAQQRREIERQARDMDRQRQAIERQARAQATAESRARAAAERERKAEERERRAAERARQRSIDSAIRTGGRVVTSRAGQDLIRGVFGTLFGGRK